ncbi:MAG: alpha/beta fold hydrolase [Desulfotomaculales bacterium]
MPAAVVGGRKIFYATGGMTGEDWPVVYVHGAGGTAHVWKNQLGIRVPGFCQAALELPGHGRSEGSGAKDVAVYRDFVRDFLQAVFGRPAVLVGHSMGGAIAMSFALAYPGWLKGLVLVGTGARLRVAPAVLEAALEPERSAALLRFSYSPGTPEEVREEAEKEFGLTPPEVRYNDFLACDSFDVMGRLREIKMPVLVVCGEDDQLTPVKYARYLQENIPGARLVLVPGAGHMVMWEQPEQVNAAIAGFLAELAGRSRAS